MGILWKSRRQMPIPVNEVHHLLQRVGVSKRIRLDTPSGFGSVMVRVISLPTLAMTANLSDPDGSLSNQSYQWKRSASAGGTFANISTNGTSATYVLVAADVEKYLKVTVSYTDGQGAGKSATSNATGQIGASNFKPTFDDGMSTMRSLPENSTTVTNVWAAVAASDSDSGDTLTYGLKSGGDSGSFTILPTSGQIQTKTRTTYDYEATKNSYTVTVAVHDGKDSAGNSSAAVDAEIEVTVDLTNVNEAPKFTGGTTGTIFPENSTDEIETFTASDVDASTTFTWSVASADDGNFFQITSSGVLSFMSAPDFENRADAGGNNVCTVRVTVTDNGSPAMSASRDVAVTVTNVNEPPLIMMGPATFSVDENTPTTEVIGTYMATDVDALTTLAWSVAGNDSGNFTITKNAAGHGELKFKNVPNYEMPTDTGGDNKYNVTETVSDGSLTDMQIVIVTVDDFNETSVVSGNADPGFAEIAYGVTSAVLTIGRTYTVNLTATDSAGSGAIIIVTMEVAEAMLHKYDLNGNGVIERDGVVAAVADYFDGDITKEEVIEFVKLHFAGSE